MDIPITISTKGNHPELYRDLFGLGDEVKDPEILKVLGQGARIANKSATIMEGVTLSEAKGRQYRVAESLETKFVDYNFILAITSNALSLGLSLYDITSRILDKLTNYNYKIKIGDKEVGNKDEFQKTLDEFIKQSF
jgi:hypothetical protein